MKPSPTLWPARTPSRSPTRWSTSPARVAALLVQAALATAALAQASSGDSEARHANLLGRIEFPNSGLTEAQQDFVEGVLYLHNFEYEDAANAFRRAQEIDPLFALAYWGEAMTHNHPIWMQQDRDAANEVLARYAPSADERLAQAPSERERAYLEAIELLYGNLPTSAELDKKQRDFLYLDAMAKLSERWPEDDEARSFHALAILGSAHDGRDFATYMRAAATAMPVWDRNPEHPGAAHYLIHSFDDPVHAPLGLPMARVYAEIAPDAAHAQHMTSHIFVALGLWPDVIDANVAARRVQNEGMAAKDRRDVVCGHYPYWLHYGYLQRGQLAEADEVMQACQARMNNEPEPGEEWHFAMMRARDVLDRADGSRAAQWTADLEDDTRGRRQRLWIDAWAALEGGDLQRAGEALFLLGDVEPGPYDTDEHVAIEVGQIEALIRIGKGDVDAGLQQLGELAERQSALPFAFGPPEMVKPTWELYGEHLLAAERTADAAAAFQKQLERTPRRTASLLGLARARAALDDPRAADQWAELGSIWADAQDGTPGLADVRAALAEPEEPAEPEGAVEAEGATEEADDSADGNATAIEVEDSTPITEVTDAEASETTEEGSEGGQQQE